MHPHAALDFPSLEPSDPLRRGLAEASRGYASPRDFYVSRIAEGVGTIAAAFFPRPVVVRRARMLVKIMADKLARFLSVPPRVSVAPPADREFSTSPLIRSMSDFKSNEYSNLLGGDRFEPQEENPMLGFRGAPPRRPPPCPLLRHAAR